MLRDICKSFGPCGILLGIEYALGGFALGCLLGLVGGSGLLLRHGYLLLEGLACDLLQLAEPLRRSTPSRRATSTLVRLAGLPGISSTD